MNVATLCQCVCELLDERVQREKGGEKEASKMCKSMFEVKCKGYPFLSLVE